jgi:hypothetical protein
VTAIGFFSAGLLCFVVFGMSLIFRQVPLITVGPIVGVCLALVGERFWRLAVSRSRVISTPPDRETSEGFDTPIR